RSDGKSSDEPTCCPNAAGCRNAPCSIDLALPFARDHSGEFSSVAVHFTSALAITRNVELSGRIEALWLCVDLAFPASLTLQFVRGVEQEATMKRERALKVVLVLVGLLFCAAVYPLMLMAKQDPALAMMMSLYVTLGIFLLLASRNPSAHR